MSLGNEAPAHLGDVAPETTTLPAAITADTVTRTGADPQSSPTPRVVLVSGVSGAGKTVALRALEDCGFTALDNLPVPFLAPVVAHLIASGHRWVAAAVDVRSGDLSALPAAIAAVTASCGPAPALLFLDARDEVLLARFSETRRAHPLAREGTTLSEAIAAERALLAPYFADAHRIDTSELNSGQLRRWLREWALIATGEPLTLTFQSFGYKHGLPLDADLVFDARCLPNPHYDPQLRPLTGQEAPVQAFLDAQPEAQQMAADLIAFLERWLPHYRAEHRAYLTVAIGCTGGQHRSVYLVERLAAHFRASARVLVRHRALAA